MEDSQINLFAALPLGKGCPVPITYEAGWAQGILLLLVTSSCMDYTFMQSKKKNNYSAEDEKISANGYLYVSFRIWFICIQSTIK
jgi:hypothetical protein